MRLNGEKSLFGLAATGMLTFAISDRHRNLMSSYISGQGIHYGIGWEGSHDSLQQVLFKERIFSSDFSVYEGPLLELPFKVALEAEKVLCVSAGDSDEPELLLACATDYPKE